jgi:Icc-related predicted phosphoesterase
VIRLAATADIHAGVDSIGGIGLSFEGIEERADALLLAGDLTKAGLPEEADVLVEELDGVGIPVIAVLGNHDYHSDAETEITRRLEGSGITVLEGTSCTIEARGTAVGVAGVKGFGGGFAGASGSEFGEPEMKAFVRHTRQIAERLRGALEELDTDVRVALMHYSPIPETLRGEPPEIFPFLGSYLLSEAVDTAGADLVLHGHAHRGSESGVTPGGVRVRNVAQPVLRRSYALFTFAGDTRADAVDALEIALGE